MRRYGVVRIGRYRRRRATAGGEEGGKGRREKRKEINRREGGMGWDWKKKSWPSLLLLLAGLPGIWWVCLLASLLGGGGRE